jgi:hypothetical protein
MRGRGRWRKKKIQKKKSGEVVRHGSIEVVVDNKMDEKQWNEPSLYRTVDNGQQTEADNLRTCVAVGVIGRTLRDMNK